MHMAREKKQSACPDCEAQDCGTLDRRDFLTSVGAATLAAGGLSIVPSSSWAAPSRTSAAETAVKRLYESLTAEQKKEVVLPWDDKRRQTISANWHVTKANVGSFSKEQQKIIDEILRGVSSGDGYERFQKQMQADNGGVANYSVAIFGNPVGGDSVADKFEFELTGRHLTLRADGDTAPGAAFGGPIVYGHGAEGDAKRNLFWYQTKRANEVFDALNPEQRKKALLAKAPSESAVRFRKEGAALPGIPGSDLSKDQLELVQKVLADILSPYRKEDIDEVMECVKAGGGFEKIHIAFYQTGDIGDDGVWDIWRLEGPTLVSHFRGSPHVHAYLNVAKRT
jgi:hypothetical protein